MAAILLINRVARLEFYYCKMPQHCGSAFSCAGSMLIRLVEQY